VAPDGRARRHDYLDFGAAGMVIEGIEWRVQSGCGDPRSPVDSDIGRVHESGCGLEVEPVEKRSWRKVLPDHLPRESIRLGIKDPTCVCCGGALQATGESVSEMLDWVPAQLCPFAV
jgi:hypothetical protein